MLTSELVAAAVSMVYFISSAQTFVHVLAVFLGYSFKKKAITGGGGVGGNNLEYFQKINSDNLKRGVTEVAGSRISSFLPCRDKIL